MKKQNKYNVLVKVLEKRVNRLKEKQTELEQNIDSGVSTNRVKQEYVEVKAKIAILEEIIDISDSLEELKE